MPRPVTGPAPRVRPVVLESNFTRDEYLRAVRRTREYIAAGDIFQVNLSQRFAGVCPSDGLDVYCRLQEVNPAPFAAYLRYPELEVMSSSPERFLLVEGDRVATRPIKGTRPRADGDDAFNRRMRAELEASAKDHAELTMIVDLERNDLGRVCRYGTVRVEEHAVIEQLPDRASTSSRRSRASCIAARSIESCSCAPPSPAARSRARRRSGRWRSSKSWSPPRAASTPAPSATSASTAGWT